MDSRQYKAYPPLLIRDNPKQQSLVSNSKTRISSPTTGISNSYNNRLAINSSSTTVVLQQQPQYQPLQLTTDHRRQTPGSKLPAIKEEYGYPVPQRLTPHQQYQQTQHQPQQQQPLHQQQSYQQPAGTNTSSYYQVQSPQPQQQHQQQHYSTSVTYIHTSTLNNYASTQQQQQHHQQQSFRSGNTAIYNGSQQSVSQFYPQQQPHPKQYQTVQHQQQPQQQQVNNQYNNINLMQNSAAMNSGTGYAIPTPVPYSNAIAGQQQPQPNQSPQQGVYPQASTSPYSTSAYSTSPHPRNSYPNSPAQQQGQYMSQKDSATDLLTNEVLSILSEKDVTTNQQQQQQQLNYHTSPAQQSQRVGGGYVDPQNFSHSPPDLTYYPSDQSQQQVNYSVKLPSGVVHQYPVPDYMGGPPSSQLQRNQQQQPPNYSTSNYMPPPQKQVDFNNHPPSINTYQNQQTQPQHQQQQQQHSPQVQQQFTNSPHQTVTYHTQSPLSSSQPQHSPQQHPNISQNQYNQLLPQISPLKQEDNAQKSNSYQTQQPTQAPYIGSVLTPPDFNSYRNTGLDSPQGSPMPAPQQPSPNVYKGPGPTPPMQRKSQPDRQISNELYNIGSPSTQLSLGDMSLNSPRPRSETVDMEAPPLPPRSPNPSDSNQYVPDPDEDAKKMPPPPPPSQIQSSISLAPNQPTPQTAVQGNQPVDRRLRSGTVEMVDAGPQHGRNGGPPSQRYLPSQQTPPQRSRAGTVEMIDSSVTPSALHVPEQRIRSGTVEMSETSQPPPSSNQQLPASQTPVAPGVKTEYNNPPNNQHLPKSPPPPYTNAQSENTMLPPPSLPGNVPTSAPNKMLPPSNVPIIKQGQVPNNKAHLQQQHQQLPPATVYNGYVQQQQQQLNNSKPPLYPPQTGAPVIQHQRAPNQQELPPMSSQHRNQQHLTYTSVNQASPMKGRGPPVQNNAQTANRVNTDPNSTYKTSNGQVPVQGPAYDNNVGPQGPGSPVSGLGVENLKLYPQLPQQKQRNVTIKQEPPNTNAVGSNELNEQELNQQQKVMQQQYMQRVRQAQLQQQLRQLQSDYENSLQVEQDVAQEFLREQQLNDKASSYAGQSYPTGDYSTQPLQHPPQQAIQPLQHNPPYLQHPNMPARNYSDPNIYSQDGSPQMPMSQQQQGQPRMQYNNKDVPVFPVTGIPLNQPQYQARQPYQHQMPPTQQQRSVSSQPVVIMPGGGSFSNPGQFVPTSNIGGSRKDQQSTGDPRTPPRTAAPASSGGGKAQTPFQKLRKIAEEISSFVDDVVKFKGKKGDHEYKYLEEMLTQQLLLLDKVAASGSDELRNARKSLVKEVQELLEILERRATQRN